MVTDTPSNGAGLPMCVVSANEGPTQPPSVEAGGNGLSENTLSTQSTISQWMKSPAGVIPKGRTPGKWRLITALSFPKDGRVNNAIMSNLYSLTYTLVDRVARAAHRLGFGALLVKADIKVAYRLVPVHADNRSLLDMQWKGEYFV